MNTQESLINAGYKKHVSSVNQLLKCTDTLYQKLIYGDVGKKYFIDAWYYPESGVLPESIHYEVEFYHGVGESAIRVILHNTDSSRVESKFEYIWNKLGLGYYEKFD